MHGTGEPQCSRSEAEYADVAALDLEGLVGVKYKRALKVRLRRVAFLPI